MWLRSKRLPSDNTDFYEEHPVTRIRISDTLNGPTAIVTCCDPKQTGRSADHSAQESIYSSQGNKSIKMGDQGPPQLGGVDFDGKIDGDKEIDEKPLKKSISEGEDEEIDIDALINDLESDDGYEPEEADDEPSTIGGPQVPESMLGTDTASGLNDQEVLQRRKIYGLNQMKAEKENMIKKFFMFFVGPIQFVMEVSIAKPAHPNLRQLEEPL